MALSIIIPAYNEEECLPRCVGATLEAFEGLDFEIVVVNDGSTDRTDQVARQLERSHPRLKYVHYSNNGGKTYAILRGLEHCRCEYVSWLDADLQYLPADLAAMYREIRQSGYPLLMGVCERKYESPIRRLLSWAYNLYISLLFQIRIKDVNALKIVERHRLAALDLLVGQWLLDLEVILELEAQGCELRTFPVRVQDRIAGETKWRLSGILITAIDCLRLRLRRGRRPFGSRPISPARNDCSPQSGSQSPADRSSS